MICKDISVLTPLACEACMCFLSECKARGINIFITETFRSQARQDRLYAQGRTTPGKIVTWTRTSRHTSRMAWDIACEVPLPLYDTETLKKAGEVARDLGISWGGSWETPDLPHFEISEDWKPKTKIRLNGKEKFVEAINKDGYNYIKLRDLADEKIKVDYDGIPIISVVK